MRGISEIFLQNNNLNGSIPPGIGNLENLELLILWANQLGNLPSELGNLNNLTILNLNNCQLTGGIPPELGNLNNLNVLNINLNTLNGNIPAELGNLSNLTKLNLYSNQFSGVIPSELGNLSDLTDITLYNNSLSGCYDYDLISLCAIADNTDISNGNNFDATFEDFCATNAGACNNSCIDDLIINSNTPFQNLHLGCNTITTQGSVVIQNNQQVEYNAPERVTLNNGFKAPSSATFKVRNEPNSNCTISDCPTSIEFEHLLGTLNTDGSGDFQFCPDITASINISNGCFYAINWEYNKSFEQDVVTSVQTEEPEITITDTEMNWDFSAYMEVSAQVYLTPTLACPLIADTSTPWCVALRKQEIKQD